ncbi:hypothetical protein QBC38DRAFT_372431 [Podospora fimiseda]|uniref:C2H2-type domain-containing protein n=1 Tax=Podospora fimiseda TaxID=252190 RepID=A0AAN7GPF3_9PEZI|nr:hypothetical protein QBC38DRAFT_372431 [Podospora fimiseda]
MDPPAVRRANQQPQSQSSQGFPSPNQEYARINPKFIDDCTRMTYAIQQSLPEAVRRVVRDNWDKCLLGSEFHQAFILNASIHHALPSITQRAVTDFGAKLVSECLPEIIGHISTARLDEVADSIIAKASNAFLDKCLEKRLPTIEVEPLTQALARAERLGFRHDDEIQREGQHERVIPHEAYPGASVPWAASHHHAPPPAPEYYSVQPLQCSRCFRTFKLAPPYDYHMRYGVCSLPPPTANGFLTSCPHCGQGFERQEDLNGHLHAQACDYLGTTPPASQQPPPVKLSRGPGRPRRSSPPSQAPVSILPSQGTPAPPNGHLPSQHSTPLPSRVAAVAATPTTASPSGVDPYAHLTQEQRDRMNAELLEAEQRYGPRFLEAEMIADENEKRAKIDGLRNSFGTKQSMIRKKYGVRLRERRTKAEIAAERERLGLKKAEKENALAAAKEALASAPQTGRGWVAANTNTPQDEGHDAKRRRLADGGSGNVTPFRRLPEEEEDTPTRKISGSGGGGDQQQQDQPGMIPERPSPRIPPSATPTLSGALKPEQPSQPSEQISLEDDDDESSSSDDEDIPPTLPAHIRQSLANSSPLGKAGGGGGGGLVRGMLPGERTSSSTTP